MQTYFELKSFPDVPFYIESVKDKGKEIQFDIVTQNSEQEYYLDNPIFREELSHFLKSLVEELLENAEDILKEPVADQSQEPSEIFS